MEREKNWRIGDLYKGIPLQSLTCIVILVVFIAIVSIVNRSFLDGSNIQSLLTQIAPMGIISIGAAFVIITGGIDFSTGTGLAMAAVFGGVMYQAANKNLFVMVLSCILLGAVLGAVNGAVITILHLQPFIVTLATMSLAQGAALFIAEGRVVFLNDPAITRIGSGNIFGFFPTSFFIFIVVCIIAWILLNRTKMGIYIYAIGGNEEAARFSGIQVERYKFFAFLFAGVCTGLGALITICRIEQVAPNISGTTQLDAIAAAVMGGVSLSGGKGNISGIVLGVFIIGVISTSLTFMKIPVTAQDAIKGMIILGVLLIDSFFNRHVKRIVK